MFRQTVVELKDEKYQQKCARKMINEVLAFRKKSKGDKEWICRTCHLTLKSGKMLTRAKANNLYLAPQPKVMRDMNSLELRLMSENSIHENGWASTW